jgi:spore coat polysaccharide biosynthesis protein SpsF (cytidylyltransferase family)
VKIGVIVQARMSSRRLPGKVLLPVGDRPLLGHLLDGLRLAREADTLLVATSQDVSDDPVAAFCASEGTPCFRGPLDDVATRFRDAARAHSLDAFVRICGDSPLLDHRLVDAAAALFRHDDADVVSNVSRRTFPKGQSVEVVGVNALLKALMETDDPLDREHVTRYFYAHPERFTIRSFESGRECAGVNLCVDTTSDLRRMAALFASLEKPHWTYGWERLASLAEVTS